MTRALPSTPALRTLRDAHVAFEVHPYRYEERGGTRVSSRELGVEEHAIVKTLVLRDEARQPILMLMHGDCKVSLKALARVRGVRAIEPCSEDEAHRATGYRVGGTSPFGTRRALPVYLERSVCDLPRLYINGGARGLLVSMAPDVLVALLRPTLVSVATGPTADLTPGGDAET